MLKLKKVSKTFNLGTVNEKKVLHEIDLELNEGDFVTIIGGNGAGKSTLLNMISGLYPLDCGTITLDGENISLQPEHQRAKKIGRLFQDPMLGTAGDMQILENLALAKRRGKKRGLTWGVSKEEKEEYIGIIKEESDRLLHLSSDILKLSKLQNQNRITNKKEISIAEQIRKIISTLEPKWRQKNLRVQIDLIETPFIRRRRLYLSGMDEFNR